MSDEKKLTEPSGDTERLPRVSVDDRGRSVWTGPIGSGEFELISTASLRAILDSDDDVSRQAIEEVADGGDEGVLVRDATTGMFRVIDENELQALLVADGREPATKPPSADVTLEPIDDPTAGSEFSLVSTQALRKIIRDDNGVQSEAVEPELEVDPGGGFDPYNSS